MNENYEIDLKEIDKGEAARYLGYKDTLPDINMTKLILQCEIDLLKIIKSRYCYKVFDINLNDDYVELKGSTLKLTGKSITEHLKGCEKAVVMCATLSGEVDKLLRKNEISDMVNTLIIDALSNAAIEQVCEEALANIMKNFEGYEHTWRFGVGYGDFPLTTQKPLLETLDAGKRIGVCVTDSLILTPRKSVTCVFGISKNKVESKSSCESCNLKDHCEFRKAGKSCNKN